MSQLIKWLQFIILCLCSSQTLAYWSCAWPYRTTVTVQETSASTLSDYQVKLTISGADLNGSYNWSDDGFDLRVVDSDDQTLMNYWVDDWDKINKTATIWVRFDTLVANSSRDIYLYYGNEFADTLANVPFTFTEPGIKFHTRNISTNPNSLSEAFSLFNAANDNNSNYGCTFITNFTGVENSTLFGSNINFIAYSETYFQVQAGEEGEWGIRYGSDFGGGGGLYVNGITLEEDWSNDLWWNFNWGNGDVLQGTINLTEGYHKLEVIGQEGGNDGGITVQFQKPSGSFTTYSTANIDIVSRACPVNEPTVTFGAHATGTCPAALAQYRLDGAPWSVAGDVIDQTGNFPGTMLGAITEVESSKVCSGAQVTANNQGGTVSAIQTGVDLDSDVGPVGSFAFWVKLNNDWNDGSAKKLMDASLLTNGLSSEKYFFLDKLADGSMSFKFEDSADGDFTLLEPSGANRLANTWYHVTLTFDLTNGNFQIYVDESLVVAQAITTSGALIDLNTIQFGDKITSPSKGGTGRSADGEFDEINIYNTVISISEIRGLMAQFRACPTMDAKACKATFPDALSFVEDRTANFGYNSLLRNNPDTQVSANTIATNTGSTLFTCETANCTTGDPAVLEVSPGNFQRTNVTNDYNVNFLGNGTIGDTTNEYDDVTVGYIGTLTVDGSNSSEFFIDSLNVSSLGTLNLAAGTYWIRDLIIGYNATINVINGPVHIYVGENVSWSSDTEVNSPSPGVAGNPDDLMMYFYNSFSFGFGTTYSGTLYASETIIFTGSHFFGLVTANQINLGTESEITYDERAYDGLTSITWCDGALGNIDSIGITAATTAVNCLPTSISVSILDAGGSLLSSYEGRINVSTDVGRGDWSVGGSANGTLNNQGQNNGSGFYNMVAADGGQVELFLKNTTAENTVLTLEVDGINNTAAINFQAAGFIFSSIPTQISGLQSNSLTLQAVETDQVTGSCQSLLVNSKNIDMAVECLSPNNCAAANASINSIDVATNDISSVSSYEAVGLDFGNSSDSDASFNFLYDDAGSLRLYARYELLNDNDGATGNYLSGSSNGFVVTPAGFCIESSDSNWPCVTPGLSAACSAFKQAGDNFALTVTAKSYNASADYCSANTTVNFSGTVDVAHNLISPTSASGGDAGTFSVSSVSLASGTSSTPVNFTDMGVYTVAAGGNSYLGATLATNDSNNIGRFYPKDIFIQSNTSATYSDSNVNFTYTGQLLNTGDGSIHYLVPPSVNYVVRGFSGQTLKNYLIPLAATPALSASAISSKLGDLGSVMNVSAGFSPGVISGPNGSFEFTYTFNVNDDFVFDRDANSLIGPFTNDISINISAITEAVDGLTLANGPVNIAGSGGEIRYGRMNIQNAYGPETSPITQRWEMQYFDGVSFRLNTLDYTTAYNLADVGLISVTDVGDSSDPLLNTDSSVSASAGSTGSFNNGLLMVDWSAPLNNHFGNYLFPVSIDSWLQYDWLGAGNENPQGNVTFGHYRGHDKIIYWKEINY